MAEHVVVDATDRWGLTPQGKAKRLGPGQTELRSTPQEDDFLNFVWKILKLWYFSPIYGK